MGWGLDVGPLHAGSDGVGLRPQLKVGYEDNNVHFAAGIDDVRDGLGGGLSAQARRQYRAEGDTMHEARPLPLLQCARARLLPNAPQQFRVHPLAPPTPKTQHRPRRALVRTGRAANAAAAPAQVLKKMRAESEIRVLDDIIRLAPQLLSEIMRMTGVDIPERSHVCACTTLKVGVGLNGAICLGWADTKGFHMVGVRGQASVAVSLGGDVMAGLHHSRKLVKGIVGVSNICVEIVWVLPEPAEGGTAGKEGEEMRPEDVPGTVAAEAAAKGTTPEEMQKKGELEQPPPAADPEGEVAVEDTVTGAGTL